MQWKHPGNTEQLKMSLISLYIAPRNIWQRTVRGQSTDNKPRIWTETNTAKLPQAPPCTPPRRPSNATPVRICLIASGRRTLFGGVKKPALIFLLKAGVSGHSMSNAPAHAELLWAAANNDWLGASFSQLVYPHGSSTVANACLLWQKLLLAVLTG